MTWPFVASSRDRLAYLVVYVVYMYTDDGRARGCSPVLFFVRNSAPPIAFSLFSDRLLYTYVHTHTHMTWPFVASSRDRLSLPNSLCDIYVHRRWESQRLFSPRADTSLSLVSPANYLLDDLPRNIRREEQRGGRKLVAVLLSIG